MTEILLLGHSHTKCIVIALQSRAISVDWGPVISPSGGSPLEPTTDGTCRLQPAIIGALRDRIRPNTLCISTVAGNAHNFLALIATDPPFDFRTPDDLRPPRSGATPIPYGSVSLSLETILREGDLAMLRATKAAIPEIRYHIESPPPLADEKLVQARIDPYFLETYPEAIVADRSLRLKMWRLHSKIFSQTCAEIGIMFISAPAEAMDADGFLLPEYADTESSIHANEAYGELVADQIEILRNSI